MLELLILVKLGGPYYESYYIELLLLKLLAIDPFFNWKLSEALWIWIPYYFSKLDN